MKTTDRPVPTRRQFLTTTAGATAGMTSWLALGKAADGRVRMDTMAHLQNRESESMSSTLSERSG